VEAAHFGAGPWFTVLDDRESADWHTLDTIRMSDGERHDIVTVQLRLRLTETPR